MVSLGSELAGVLSLSMPEYPEPLRGTAEGDSLVHALIIFSEKPLVHSDSGFHAGGMVGVVSREAKVSQGSRQTRRSSEVPSEHGIQTLFLSVHPLGSHFFRQKNFTWEPTFTSQVKARQWWEQLSGAPAA